MPLRPTSTLYRWCTNTLNRVAPDAAAKLSGFRNGEPVPPLTFNDLFGVALDWINYIGNSAFSHGALVFLPTGLGNWVTGADLTFVGASGAINITSPTGGGATTAFAKFSPVIWGGQLSGVQTTVANLTPATTATITVVLTTPSGFVRFEDLNITTDGVKTLTLNAGLTTLPVDGTTGDVTVDGPFRLSVTIACGSTEDDTVRFEDFTLNWA